jgi:hypothetical protein
MNPILEELARDGRIRIEEDIIKLILYIYILIICYSFEINLKVIKFRD